MKDKDANRLAIEKAQIEALIEKHRPRTLKIPDEVNRLGTGKNAKVDDQEGNKKEKPPYKKATKDIQIKHPVKREKKPKMPKEAIQMHYWVIHWLIPQKVQKKDKRIKWAKMI